MSALNIGYREDDDSDFDEGSSAASFEEGDDGAKFLTAYDAKKKEEIMVPRVNKIPPLFLNWSTVFYGASGTGKTFLVQDGMFILKDYFPVVYVFAPTDNSNDDYSGKVPKSYIYTRITKEKIKEIYQRQEMAAHIYKEANKLEPLKSLFKRVAVTDRRAVSFYKKLVRDKNNIIRGITKQFKRRSVAKQKVKIVEDLHKKTLRKFYKKIIESKRSVLSQIHETLTPQEKRSLEYLNFNPRVLCIFDDAAQEINTLLKTKKDKKDDTMENFFFKGRHIFLTLFFTFQDDTKLNKDLRRNAHNSVFTSAEAAIEFFKKGGFTANQKRRVNAIIEEMYSDKQKKTFKKLFYSKLLEPEIQFIVAEYRDDFVMCYDLLWDACDRMEKKGAVFDKSNPFREKFLHRT